MLEIAIVLLLLLDVMSSPTTPKNSFLKPLHQQPQPQTSSFSDKPYNTPTCISSTTLMVLITISIFLVRPQPKPSGPPGWTRTRHPAGMLPVSPSQSMQQVCFGLRGSGASGLRVLLWVWGFRVKGFRGLKPKS